MKRRELLLCAAALALPTPLGAQGGKPAPRIGLIGAPGPEIPLHILLAAALKREGLEPQRDYVLDARWHGNDEGRLRMLAADLVRDGATLIVASGNRAIEAARSATRSVPVVMLAAQNPVEMKYIASLARPGGNITGTTWDVPQTAGKKLDVIREALPEARRVAVLVEPEFPGMRYHREQTDMAAAALGIELLRFNVLQAGDLDRMLERIATARPDAIYIVATGEIGRRLKEVIAFLRARKLVTFGTSTGMIAAGVTFAYGPDTSDLFQRTASYISRILKGAKPGDLPVEQPNKMVLVANVRAGNEIGVKFAPAFLLRADRVVE